MNITTKALLKRIEDLEYELNCLKSQTTVELLIAKKLEARHILDGTRSGFFADETVPFINYLADLAISGSKK